MNIVPVVNLDNQPLMPTTPSRARKGIITGKYTPFFNKGFFCVKLNIRTEENKQDIVIGIDPGSKKEGFTIKSVSHTYLNIQADAVTHVKDRVTTRSQMRNARRGRNMPCRKPRFNRKRGGLSPSTKARWQWKIRLIVWLSKMFPITHFIVEDIKAKTKGQRKWDKIFSPLEVGKKWFYNQLPNLTLLQGYETKALRDSLGLSKSKNKLSNSFDAHCVDSWVLANHVVGGHTKPDNTDVLLIKPFQFYRRQLHYFQPSKGGKRKNYGGTISLNLKRGTLVKHNKIGLCYVGGTSIMGLSLHNVETGQRIGQRFKIEDCKRLTTLKWRINGN